MDPQVQAVQEWLNDTYGAVSGWVTLTEDGVTGWATVYGLRRALQTELGISPVASGFGSATTSAFVSKVGRIDATTTSAGILRVLSAALWCKGYTGIWAGADPTFSALADSVARVRRDLGLGGEPYVDVTLMASLLSMDAYTLLSTGSAKVRAVQQWLNGTFAGHTGFALVPADGIASRALQTALLLGLQYEIGMADSVANGVFGPGTREGLRTQALVAAGSTDGTHRFVRLYQSALTLNGGKAALTGSFDSTTAAATRTFQKLMELPVTAAGDYGTWCALLVSTGDVERATTGFDTNQQLAPAEATELVALGYRTAGRYLVGANKFITAPELAGLKAAGLALLPIYQRYNDAVQYMTLALGRQHGIEATERARALGLPDGSLIFFAVDFDPTGDVITGPVHDYFTGIAESLARVTTTRYRAGVYGTRSVCRHLMDAGLAEAAFILGMSSGYSGNMGVPMPKKWQYNQIATISVTSTATGRTLTLDKDVVSTTAKPVALARVVPPPLETDGSTSATGFDAFFEWTVRAEVAAERALVVASTTQAPLTSLDGAVPDFIAGWLQARTSAGDDRDAFLAAYLPVFDSGTLAAVARAAVDTELTTLGGPASARDTTRFAAALRGYRAWGVPTDKTGYGPGDLGAWGLDLLALWGQWRGQDTDQNLAGYCRARLGARDVDSAFGWNALVADADAWLVAAYLKKKPSPTGLSQALRGLLVNTSAQRVRAFNKARFGAKASGPASAFTGLVRAVDAWSVPSVPSAVRPLVLAVAGGSLPSQAQANAMGGVLAEALASAS